MHTELGNKMLFEKVRGRDVDSGQPKRTAYWIMLYLKKYLKIHEFMLLKQL